MPRLSEKLDQAAETLRASGVPDARRDAVSLLSFVTKKDKAFFYAHPEHIITDAESELLDSLVHRRASREPLQHITGVQEFYGLEFAVTPHVLIPRPETEMLVERAIELLDEGDNFCEVGVGSGCISVSILVHRRAAKATGLDASPDALAVARRNAETHGVIDRLTLRESDVFGAVNREERFPMIVSNPPYVPVRDIDGLQAEVRHFEPHLALTDGGDGLTIIRRIVFEAPTFLQPAGHLLMEIGFDQSEPVRAMFDAAVWQRVEFAPDLQGIPRLVIARLN